MHIETLFNEAPLGIYIVDSDFRIYEVNRAALPAFGEIPDLIDKEIGEVLRTLRPRAYAEEIVRLFRHTLETGEPYFAPGSIEERLDRHTTVHYEWWINRITLPNKRSGVVCYFRDVSIQMKALQALARRQQELEDADRQKNEFLAMLAHELRNPLAPIRNSSELLSRMVRADPHAQTALATIERQVGHLARLVDDLLDVSRIAQGRVELRRAPTSLADIISRAIELNDPMIRHKRHKIASASNCRALLVNGDPERLVQCVSNVIANAVKYTNPGGEIRIDCEDHGVEAAVTVKDNGVGMSKELLPRVFDLFVQGDRTLDRAQGGLGIGLSIVKRIVEMHGGRVTAASGGPDEGSVFEIRLPLMDPVARQAVPSAAIKPSMRRILVVDDNSDAADSLAAVLGLDGHEVVAVYSGEQAIEQALAFRPEVVLLDIGLPSIDGYEVARRIRGLANQQAVHLIAVTGYGQTADKALAQAAGFSAHLVKPIEFSALEHALACLPSGNVPGSVRR